ncbi:MAG: hypothetical protein E7K88_17150 [Clostridioides difficile]|nr:hypothetical protein [Clostridioides difficile]
MLGLKKRDIKKALKVGAKMGGVSLAEVRERPTPEEYIYIITKKTKV